MHKRFSPTRSIEELARDAEFVDESDQELSVIASSDPMELHYSIQTENVLYSKRSRDIKNYEMTEETLSHLEQLRDSIGENRRGALTEKAALLQEFSRWCQQHDITPPAELLQMEFDESSLAELPSDVLGMGVFEEAIESTVARRDELSEKAEKAKALAPNHTLAENVASRRDKLGKRAKIATWLAGGVLMGGAGLGVVSSVNEALTDETETETISETESTPEAEQVQAVLRVATLAGTAAVLGVAGTASTSYAASRAQKYSARRRAKKIIEQKNQD